MSRPRLALIALCLAFIACLGPKQPAATTPAVARPAPPALIATDARLLSFELSEGAASVAGPAPIRVAESTVLGEAETAAVLARLAPLRAAAEDQRSFALPEKSLPPPRPGRVLSNAFPPPASAAPAPALGLAAAPEVVRHAPEGEVSVAPHVSLTFSEPMVAISSHEALSASAPPAALTPQAAGTWRWVGSKTLLFDPAEPRLPMATYFTVEVPAATRSAAGAPVAEATRWSFATPPPRVREFHPQAGTVRRDSLIFVAFDQRIDPGAVLQTITLRADDTIRALRLASEAEIASDETVRDLVRASDSDAGHGRHVVFRAEQALPADAAIEVAVGPGTPSAEGPRKSITTERFEFRTFGPLRVTSSECGHDGNCEPLAPWSVQWSNPIDPAKFDRSMLRVTPELPELHVEAFYGTISISGRSRANTSYQVTFAPNLPDIFGQTLGQERSVSFQVGHARPVLLGPEGPLTVLDPAARGRLSVYSSGHPSLAVRAYAVRPENWDAYVDFMRESQRDDRAALPPGEKLIDTEIAVAGDRDALTETSLDLTPALSAAGHGHVIVQVRGTTPVPEDRPWERQELRSWVQVTEIGLSAFADAGKLIGWASALSDGAPLDGVELSLWPDGQRARTGPDGLCSLTLSALPSRVLVARRGEDSALLPESVDSWYAGGGWVSGMGGERLIWYVADDRNLYRPGESLRFKGWLRRLGAGQQDELGLPRDAIGKVAWALFDAQGNPLGKGESGLTSLGGFDGKVELPRNMNLGNARLEFRAPGGPDESGMTLPFQVQEYRRPEFVVSVETSAAPHFVGEAASLTASARYYAGGALPQAETHWQLTASPGTFAPPNRDDFTFGIWKPWWILGGGDAVSFGGGIARRASLSAKIGYPGPAASEQVMKTWEGRTDATGLHHLRVDFLGASPPQPVHVRADVAVSDVNRQQWSATANLLVHPATQYVGLRSERYFIQPGEPLPVEAIVVDLDGKALIGRPIQIRAARLQWEQVGGELQEQEVDAQACDAQSAADAVRCTFHPQQGGQYRISALIHDERGRPNLTQFVRWVAGEKTLLRRELAEEAVTLIPSQKQFQPGQVAEVLVMAPFFPAEGTLTLRRSGIVRTQRFRMDGPTHVLRVPLEDRFAPNVYLQVDLVGSAERRDDAGNTAGKLGRRPAYASGQLNLELPPRSRTLALDVKPESDALEPGASTHVDLTVRGPDGKPVAGAELAVAVVDEAVLALTDYRLPDPLSVFYAQRAPGAEDTDLRQHVLLVDPQSLLRGADNARNAADSMAVHKAAATSARLSLRRGDEMLAESEAAAPPPIALRSDFDALAAWSAVVVTDSAGRAQLPVKLPDNLTRYRVMALAAHGEQRFGSGEAVITARLPLMVRPSAPRFLNFGDAFELPVVVQNQTGAPLQVDLAMRAANAEPGAGLGRRLTVPPNDRVEVRFPAAAKLPGTARFQVAGMSGAMTDAAEFALPVWTPATSEAFATYGAIDSGAIAQKISAPPDVWKEFGGLELTTSSTALQALTDAVLYLVDYPFECSEQMASRLLALAALKDVLGAFDAKGLPPREQLLASVDSDLQTLSKLQNDDGGFGFWRRGEPSWPYLSIHVAHALARLRSKGFAIPDAMLERVRGYINAIEQHIPADYGPKTRRTLVAYSLYTRELLGDADRSKARAVLAEGGGPQRLNLEALGFLYPVLAHDPAAATELASIRRHLQNRVEETAATAHFITAYSDDGHLLLHSERRADALILEGLIGDQPRSDLIPKLVAGLLAERKAGHWESTQENAFVLLALDRYFASYEQATPDFVARAWLGQSFAAEQRYRGRSTEQHRIELPMSYLLERSPSDLLLEKTGAGRLYYRLGMQYAPRDLDPPPVDHGFTVERVYEAVDAPGDVQRTPDGAWRIRAGARVRVRVTMVAEAHRHHVALVDPLPAGLEVLNPALATSGAPPEPPFDPLGAFGWRARWYDHENLRDQQAEAFTFVLPEGIHEYAYIARATTPGSFVAPPSSAEEMYHPETFGRGAGDRVIITE